MEWDVGEVELMISCNYSLAILLFKQLSLFLFCASHSVCKLAALAQAPLITVDLPNLTRLVEVGRGSKDAIIELAHAGRGDSGSHSIKEMHFGRGKQ
jgi:hypothetical protein